MKCWSRRAARTLTAATVLVAAGCESDPTGPTLDDIVGSYSVVTLTTTTEAGTVDRVAEGASLGLQLNADGTVSGELFVPGGAEDGSDFTADMAGTWTLSGSIVRFEQDADSFVRDMDFEADGDRLTGEETFGDVTVRVVLEQGASTQ